MSLINRINEINATAQCNLTTDIDHWNDLGVYTASDLDRYLDEQTFFELFEAWFGIKPDANAVNQMSDEKLHEHVKFLSSVTEQYGNFDDWTENL